MATVGHTYQNIAIHDARVQLGDIYQSQPTSKRVLEWLPASNTGANHISAYEHYYEGTLNWLFAHQTFLAWKNEDCSVILCQGDMGTGKTVLTAAAIEHMRELFTLRSDVSICYFYFQYRRAQSQTLSKVFGTILKQMLHKHDHPIAIPHYIEEEYRRNFMRQPLEKQLRGWLSTAVAQKRRVYIFLDGMDEMDDFAREQILSALTYENVSLFITTKILRDVNDILKTPSIISISKNRQSIREFVISRLRTSTSKRVVNLLKDNPSRSPDGLSLESDIVDRIASNADGMFLLASLLLHLVQRCLTLPDIYSCLDAFPKTLEEYLDRTWERLTDDSESQNWKYVRVTFGWLLHAYRPLEWEELQRGLYLYMHREFPETLEELDSNMMSIADILTLTGGLLADPARCADGSLVDYTPTVEFTHVSVRQYFERRLEELLPSSSDVITTLVNSGFSVRSKADRDHSPGAPANVKRSESRWLPGSRRPSPGFESKLRLAVYASIYTATETLLNFDVQTSIGSSGEHMTETSFGRTSRKVGAPFLHYAVHGLGRKCDARMLMLLVAQRVSINAKDGDGNTALHKAAAGFRQHNFRDKLHAIRYLVEKGADANIKNNKGLLPLPDWKIEEFKDSKAHRYELSFSCLPGIESFQLDYVDLRDCGIWKAGSRIHILLRGSTTSTEIIKRRMIIAHGLPVVQSVLPSVLLTWKK